MTTAWEEPRPPRLARRMETLAGEGAFDVLARAGALEAQGRTIVHLEVGQPDAPTPAHVVEAGMRAIRDGETRYTAPAGLPELRQAIAESTGGRSTHIDPRTVVVTPGAKPMLFYSILATIDPGDEVLVPDPGFPAYPSAVRFAQGSPVSYGLRSSARFAPDVDEIAERITRRTKAIVLNAPHNPTGGSVDTAALVRLLDLAERHNLTIISDEVYDELVYDGPVAPTLAARSGIRTRVFAVRSFSKTYAMTGWRLGYGIVPPAFVDRIVTLAVNGHSCVPGFVQRAGIAALNGPQTPTTAMRDAFRQRRDWLVPALAAIPGVTCALPRGAFYAFPNVGNALANSRTTVQQFADLLLEQHGVAVLPGTAFGERGASHLRISFAASREELELGVRALAAAAAELRAAASVPA
jgi:aspartate aminotransferase